MAHETAKKNARTNASRLRLFKGISAGILILSFLVDWFLVNRSATWWGAIMWSSFWSFHYFLTLFFLTAVGKPTINRDSGEIVECIDMTNPQSLGVYSYAQDILWFCWALQPLQVLFSNHFMLLYVPLPLFAIYKVYATFISPLLSARSNMAGMQQEQMMQQQQQQGAKDPRARLAQRREQTRGSTGRK